MRVNMWYRMALVTLSLFVAPVCSFQIIALPRCDPTANGIKKSLGSTTHHSSYATTTTTPFATTSKKRFLLPALSMSSTSSSSSSSIALEELESLFQTFADENNMLSKSGLVKVPLVQELLSDGDLLQEELDEMWQKYAQNDESGITLESFCQFYREIDDLFEEEEEEEVGNDKKAAAKEEEEVIEHELLMEDLEAKEELEGIFQVISNEDGMISKHVLRMWDEIETLIVDGMLGDEEFEELWEQTPKINEEFLDLQGFLIFNTNLDELFDFDDSLNEEEEEDSILDDDEEDDTLNIDEADTVDMELDSVQTLDADEKEEDLFRSLAGSTGVIDLATLVAWDELKEMIKEEDILPEEVEQMYTSALTKSKDESGLDESGFQALRDAIDDLFEEVDEDDDGEEAAGEEVTATAKSSFKADLLRALAVLESNDEEEERLPCGLESTDREDKLILNLAGGLMQEKTSNLLLQKEGLIETEDIAGDWKLLYTSSSAMKFNKGLSGIAGSFPNGKFGGLTQSLSASTLLPDVEYKEHVEINPSSASFDVIVNGNWELRQSISLFTGEKSVILAVEPDRVRYGPTSTKADHWKSLGPTNMLDVVYLDEDLRIMRGSTSMDTILIFQRI